MLGVGVSVASNDPAALGFIDEMYAAFRSARRRGDSELAFRLERKSGGTFVVADSTGYEGEWPTRAHAVGDVLSRLLVGVLHDATARGIYAIHAGAVERDGRVVLFSGQSGAGKTTLTLSLLVRGFRLLSDELAVVEPSTRRILPYRRSLHVRSGTAELVPELERVVHASRAAGRIRTLTPALLEEALPGCLAPAAELTHVLLLEGEPGAESRPSLTPVTPAAAALELLRATWAASVDFDAGLARLTRLLEGVSCARLRIGGLQATTDLVSTWLDGNDG